jgi:acyl-CoA oxidase
MSATTSTTGPADTGSGTSALYGDVLPHSSLDFTRERNTASFNIAELCMLCSGGIAYQAAKTKTARQLARIPWVADIAERWPDLSRAEKRQATLQQIRALFRMFINDHGDVMMRNARVEMASLYSPDWVTRNGVHFGLFVGAIVSQASVAQADEWLPRAMGLSLFGCFAMTELRGGSYVKGLQTTATYIPASTSSGSDGSEALGCWEIHTPHVGATKWWIGGAGETATHAAVYARALCKGKDCGVHVFLVQLRDMSTHAPLPGVHIGDVGGKMGRDGIDNGWIQFHHYRVPHSAFLCKYARVDADGTYTPQPAAKPQLAYGALIQGRAHMVQDSASILQLAVTIAVRWAIARRQGTPFNQSAAQKEPCDPALEPQLLDYSTHQAKLLPLVATAYAFTFTAHRMKEMYENVSSSLAIIGIRLRKNSASVTISLICS